MKANIAWLGAVLILVIIIGTIYTAVQQSQRSDANYPQIQIAQDAAAALNSGAQPKSLLTRPVNLNSELDPFIIIYDKYGQVVAGSGYLNGKVPTIALGVLTSANNKNYSHVTWQPQPGVRIAAVSVASRTYYILSGRSLREVEINESKSIRITLLGGLCTLIVMALTSYFSKSVKS